MNIALIGYRGTGKTTVGLALAPQLGYTFRDADLELEKRAGRSIRDIFTTEGEAFFRDLESQILAELVSADQQILSLGGGVILREENRRRLKAPGIRVVWLKAGAEAIFARLHGDPSRLQSRPALTTSGPYEEIVQLLALREPLYAECAEFTVPTEGKTPEQIAAEVVSLVVV